MKWSKYNHLFESSKYGYLLFNAETNAFAKLDKETFEKLKIIEENDENINELDSDLVSELKEADVLVNDPIHFLYKKRLHYYFNAFESSNLGLAIAPTTNCNFACPYCYEENRKAVYMDKKTEANIVEFIKKHDRVRKLRLTWYGGEPLLGFESIKRLLEEFKKITHAKLVSHTMTTNGYLLDEAKSIFFKDFPLNTIQITIDGTKEHHDKRRVLAQNSQPTFDRIVANIDKFVVHNPNTRVVIRVNLDKSNKESFIDIYKEFNERWKDKGFKVIVTPAFVKDFSSVLQDYETKGCRDIICLDKVQIIDYFEELYRKHNLDISFSTKHCIGGCGATVVNYYVIGPQGELYKCWNDIGDEKAIVGYVDSDKIVNYELLTRYLAGPTMLDSEECKDCKLFPICDGGCIWARHKNIYNKGKLELCSYRKDSMDKAFEIFYEQLINQ
jgi:uncharacterized protein